MRVCGTLGRLAIAVVFVSTAGCRDQTGAEPGTPVSAAEETPFPYENGYAAYERVQMIDGGGEGELLVSGTVLQPDGQPSPGAVVTLQMVDRADGKWVTPSRCLFVSSDEGGRYEIRGKPTTGYELRWACDGDRLAVSSNESDLTLRGGETTVYVRDDQCRPVTGATVTVHLSSLDDLSHIVPPNMRKLLRRRTDEEGKVVYPSRLADFELGFEVEAPGHKILTRSFYSGLSKRSEKLFVLTVDHDVATRCRKVLGQELGLNEVETYEIEVGSPGHFHGN